MHQSLAQLKDIAGWLNYISGIHPKEMDFGLDRIQAVEQPLGWRNFSCPVVAVGGTNGKGSCVRFLESIFTAAGYRVGTFTSPHLMHFHERIRVNDNPVDDATLIQAFLTVEQSRQGISLSFFEFTFLAALYIFHQQPLDLVILEVGLGGRLDAVNIVDADISVISTIDLDHTDILGPDRETIAAEKAGIFRHKKPVVCGDPRPPLSLRERAVKLSAKWHALGENFHFENNTDGQAWNWYSSKQRLQYLPPLSLKHQNAATSLMVTELLHERLPVNDAALRQGLAQAVLAGRFEKIPLKSGFCYLDVAHNPEGARWLSQQWQKIPVNGKRIAIFGMLRDKDIAESVQSLLHYVNSWYTATLSVPRGASAQHLKEILNKQGAQSCYAYETVEAAVEAAIAEADLSQDVILIFGSFYTVAAAKSFLLKSQGVINERHERTHQS